MDIALRLLGPFQLAWQGAEIAIASTAGRALLAYLALEPGRAHSRELLAALLWPERPRAAAYANLRQTLARLRAAVPDLAAISAIDEQALQLIPGAMQIDVTRFQELLAEAAEHAHGTLAACPACLDRLAQAAELYQGELLAGLFIDHSAPFEEWLLFKREQLHQQALSTLATLSLAHEANGDFAAMRRFAARQVALEPWREPAHVQLIRALLLLNQRSAALAQYEKCRAILQQELGVEPAAETRALYERIRRGATAAPSPPGAGARHNLPAQLTPCVGREREIAQIVAALQSPDVRLLTLAGAGGMGKTRLAVEVARTLRDAYPDGVYLVALAPLAARDAIPPAIAAASGLRLRGPDPEAALLEALRDKRMLLVLDNFEQLINGAGIVVDLLAAAQRLQILVTSREQLNLRGEHVYLVEALAYLPAPGTATTPAAQLFAQAARRAQPGFALSAANSAAVQRICRLVEGMPLGLELAAAWAGTLSLDEIAAEIAGSADFLTSEWRDAPPRQRSMRAVFDWSWALLNDAERQALGQLALFRGGFSREAAQAVAGASLAVLARLQRKSLLRRSDGQTGAGRYELHELLRQFAAQYLDADPVARAAAEARHGAYFLRFVAQRERPLLHDEPRQAVAEIRAELDNVRLAWNWATLNGSATLLHESMYALSTFCWQAGLMPEAAGLAALAVERLAGHLATSADAAALLVAARTLGRLTAMKAATLFAIGSYDAALLAAQQAVELSQASGSKEGETVGCLIWGEALYHKGEYEQAIVRIEQAWRLAASYRAGQPELDSLGQVEWAAQIWLMAVMVDLGRDVEAAAHGNAALQLCRSEGRRQGELSCLVNLAGLAHRVRDLPAARRYCEQALQLAPVVGSRWEEAAIRLTLGDVVRLQGEYGLAISLTRQTLAIAREIAAPTEEASATACLARLHSYSGDAEAARHWLAQFWSVSAALTAPESRAEPLLAAAILALHSGAHAEALAHATEARRLALAFSHPYIAAHTLVVLGHAQAALGLAAAASSYEQALQLYTARGHAALAAEPRAALAWLAFTDHDLPTALRQIDAILAVLAQQQQVGLDEPFYVYLVCYRVLRAVADRRANAVLQDAQNLLRQYADRIDDATLRQSFLKNVPAHRDLWQATTDLIGDNRH